MSAYDPKRTLGRVPENWPLQLRGGDLVKIGCDELSCEGGLGEKDNVNHALIPEARFCVSKSQSALKLRYVCVDAPGMMIPSCGPAPKVCDSFGHNIAAQPRSGVI
jgi:hypothetical protein